MKTVYITGGNSGLGYAVARKFLSDGYHVIIACRHPRRAEKARQTLIAGTGKENVEVSLLDLASLSRIRQAVHSLTIPVDILICNAGISYSNGLRFTEDGYEETFGVNHLGHFLLTQLMLSKFSNLKRIAIVSSNLHNPKTSAGMFPAPFFSSIEELAYPENQGNENMIKKGRLAYVNSKLCNVLFTYRLDEMLKQAGRHDVFVNAFNPGFIPGTNLSRDTPPSIRFLMKYIMPRMKLFIREIRTAEESAGNLKKLITGTEVSGKYFDGAVEIESSPLSYDRNLSAQLWEASLQMTSLQPFESIFRSVKNREP